MSKLARTTFSTRRIEALTDGVFAIAMTLLVLDMTTSEFGKLGTSADLWNALSQESSGFISFVVSFLLLGSLWAVHTRQFEYITKADRKLMAINNYRLLAVVFVPLTTSISASYESLVIGRTALMLNFLVIIAISYWQWWYASVKRPELASEKLSQRDKVVFNDRNRDTVILAAIAVVASTFIGNFAALVFALQPVISKLRSEQIT